MVSKIKSQQGYSRLFMELASLDIDRNENNILHPFEFLNFYFEEEDSPLKEGGFEQSLSYLKDLKLALNNAYDCFQIELTQLQDLKTEYLNKIIDSLFDNYHTAMSSNKIIASIIRQLFKDICQSQWKVFINSKNRNRLSKWYELREPIKSFVLKRKIEDYTFKNVIFNLMANDLFLIDSPYASFKALFEGKYLENKINWLQNKSSLVYFIKSLLESKVLQNPKNRHWEIVSEFFLLNGEQIERSELLNQKSTKDKRLIQDIDSIISKFRRRYS